MAFKDPYGKEWASEEEWHMYLWILEAKRGAYVCEYEYQPDSLELSPRQSMLFKKQLKTKVKTIDKFLLHPHKYTADFLIDLSTTFLQEFKDHKLIPAFPGSDNKNTYYIDVKGTFGGQYGSAREFSINQKWVYKEHGIFVNSLVPIKFFKNTWAPERSLLTLKTLKPRTGKQWKELKTLKEIKNVPSTEIT